MELLGQGSDLRCYSCGNARSFNPPIHHARLGIKSTSWHCRDVTNPIVPQQEFMEN